MVKLTDRSPLRIFENFTSRPANQSHKREITQPPPCPETNGGVTGALNPTFCETDLQEKRRKSLYEITKKIMVFLILYSSK